MPFAATGLPAYLPIRCRDADPNLTWECGQSGVAMSEYPSDELNRIPFFNKLSIEQLELFAETTRLLEIKRNDVVIHSGQKPRGCYCILSGTIKLVASSGDGCEKVMDILSAGMTFGEALLFLDRPSPVSAQAIEKSRLLEVDRESVLSAVRRSPDFALGMLAGLSNRLHQLVSDVHAYCLHSATERVIGYLVSEAERFDGDGERALVSLRASKATVASRLGLTPETLSRVFNQLSGEGLIDVAGRRIHIWDLDLLKARVSNRQPSVSA